MAKSRRKLIAQLKQPQYALLRDVTQEGALDAPTLTGYVQATVADRFALARGFIDAAKLLAGSGNPLIRRSAVSRAYYGAYHAARATVFAVHRRDEDEHARLAHTIDSLVQAGGAVQTTMKDLRGVRDEMDYSPYPGPDSESEYTDEQIEGFVRETIDGAERLIERFDRFLRERR
ncbi:MAG: hypothetical protein ACREJ9_18340 [Candidatus Rokuibacteriota bacterium]